MQIWNKRQFLAGGSAIGAMAMLGGCAGGSGFSLTEAIRRLLTLSSQRAFAYLLQPGGYYDSQLARLNLPDAWAENRNIITRILTSGAVRREMQRRLNDFAEAGAERAAPIIAQAINNLSVADAMQLVRGNPHGATDLLRQGLGSALITAMFPAVGDAMQIANDPRLAQLLHSATGIDVAGLTRHVVDGAETGLWNAIGAEEAAIRANPSATNDPLIIAVFGLGAA